jgi:L-lactate permease
VLLPQKAFQFTIKPNHKYYHSNIFCVHTQWFAKNTLCCTKFQQPYTNSHIFVDMGFDTIRMVFKVSYISVKLIIFIVIVIYRLYTIKWHDYLEWLLKGWRKNLVGFCCIQVKPVNILQLAVLIPITYRLTWQ